jgi:hypothetical protein
MRVGGILESEPTGLIPNRLGDGSSPNRLGGRIDPHSSSRTTYAVMQRLVVGYTHALGVAFRTRRSC